METVSKEMGNSDGSVDYSSNKNQLNVRHTRNQEAIETLLLGFGEAAEKRAEEFARQEIHFSDLAALNEEDLKLLGITDPETQREMVETFEQLPNQKMHFHDILQTSESDDYNEDILKKASSHLQSMTTSLSAANLKLKINPSGDVVVGERNFASKFVLEALDELRKVTDEIEGRLRVLENLIEKNENKGFPKGRKKFFNTVITLLGISASISVVFWLYKRHI